MSQLLFSEEIRSFLLPVPEIPEIGNDMERSLKTVDIPALDENTHSIGFKSNRKISNTRKSLNRKKRRWENELQFTRNLESSVNTVKSILDPFRILEKMDYYEKNLQKLIVIATLTITLVYNALIFVLFAIIVLKTARLSL